MTFYELVAKLDDGIVSCSFHSIPPREEFEAFTKVLSAAIRPAHRPFILLFSIPLDLTGLPMYFAQMMAAWMKSEEQYFRTHLICSYVLVKSEPGKWFVKVVLKLRPPTKPCTIDTLANKDRVLVDIRRALEAK